MVGEICLTDDKEAWNGAHQIVINPQPSHRIVRRGVDPHGSPVGIFPGDPLIHLEQIAVPLTYHLESLLFDHVGKIQVHPVAAGSDPPALIAQCFDGAGCDVARHQIAETRVAPLQKKVPLRGGNFIRRPTIRRHLGHPESPVVAEGFGHQCQFGLVRFARWNRRWMDLRKTGVREGGSLLPGPVRCGHITAARIGGEIVDIAVPARRQYNGMRRMRRHAPRDQIAHHDPPGMSVDYHQIEHFGARVHRHLPALDLPAER